jgi:hypothetical protein
VRYCGGVKRIRGNLVSFHHGAVSLCLDAGTMESFVRRYWLEQEAVSYDDTLLIDKAGRDWGKLPACSDIVV